MDTAPKAGERTLDEVKKEVLRRAGQHSPFEGVRKDDVEKIVGGLTSLDKDHWAERWSAVGLEYEGKADALAKQGARRQGDRGHLHARLQLLQPGPLPGGDHAGQEGSLSALPADVPQGGEVFRSAARRSSSIPATN